jgi:hypothetical protein
MVQVICYHIATKIFGGDGEPFPATVVQPIDGAFIAARNEMATGGKLCSRSD